MVDNGSPPSPALAPASAKARAKFGGGGIGVDFIDILFGLVVTAIFMAFLTVTKREYATWVNLALALIIVVFSWIGYHVARERSPRPASFDFLPLTQLFVDVIIVAVYLAFVQEVVHTKKVAAGIGHVISIRPEAITIVVIFALYTLWDIEQVGLARGKRKRRARATLHRNRGLFALTVFAGYSAIVVFAWRPGSNAAVITADLIYIALLYGYRVLQAFDRKDSKPSLVRMVETVPLLRARPTQ
jgi:hypothetical protein